MPPPLLPPRDPVQLDLASVSSIQVVGIVEALIQNADTLFPGGRASLCLSALRGWWHEVKGTEAKPQVLLQPRIAEG